MKILYVIAGLNRGGAETFVMNVYRNMDRDKYNVYFLVYGDNKYDYEDEIKKLGGTIIRAKRTSEVGLKKFIKDLIILFKKEKFDVVHAHSLFNCGPVMLAAYKAGIKVRISHCHTTRLLKDKITLKDKVFYSLSKHWINKYSTHLFACEKAAGEFLFNKNKEFFVVKNGIEIEKFKFDDKIRDEIRMKHNIKSDTFVIGNVGRLVSIKNQKFLIDVFEKIHKENNNTKLVILGEGELKEELINYSEKLFLNKDDVLFLGNLDNVNEYYNAFDVFVLPSLFEGLPYTLIEAQCNGLPIIVSEAVDQRSNISGNIIFCDLNDSIDNWANTILNEIGKRYNSVDSIINNGYSIADTVKFIENIYDDGVIK